MARRSRPSFMKRQKEMARQQKQNDKRARRLEEKSGTETEEIRPGGEEDPDIAGIRPGPQPPPPWADNEGR